MNAMRMEDTCDALGAIMKRMGTGRGQGRGRGRGWGTGEPFTPRRLCASRGPPAGQALTKMHLHPGLLTSLLTSLQLLLLPPLPLLLLHCHCYYHYYLCEGAQLWQGQSLCLEPTPYVVRHRMSPRRTHHMPLCRRVISEVQA